jgi:hypothetical protein
MKTEEKVQLARENWQRASMDLSFKIVSPFYLKINGKEKEVFAFLPEYGTPKGVLVALTCSPNFNTDTEIINFATANGFFYSFINVDTCLKYDERYFKEILADWSHT